MSNPALKQLGLSNNDRVVVFHADDIGNTHASVEAYRQLLGNSPLSSASTMVPCPWFPAAAQLFQEKHAHPAIDVGVHLTLTCEWDALRWGPISAADETSGLLDEEGYFHRTVEPVYENPHAAAVLTELQAQVVRAKAAGIDVTHIDTHMGSLFCPRHMGAYAQLGYEQNVPALLLGTSAEQLMGMGYNTDTAEKIAGFSQQLAARGMPLFDGVSYLPLGEKQGAAERFEYAKQLLDSVPTGLYYFIIHPAVDTPELRATAGDWEARVADCNLFLSSEWQQVVEASGVHVLGMKRLRTLLQENKQASS